MDLATLPHWQLLTIDVIGIGAAVGALLLAAWLAIKDLRREAQARIQDDHDAIDRLASFERCQREAQVFRAAKSIGHSDEAA
jgi:hypothetical protein